MKLTMLRPQVATVQGRVRMAVTMGTRRVRGSALQSTRQRILKRDRWLCRCSLCTAADSLKVADEVEHRIPLWAGGAEDDANRYAIASDCHKAKTACESRMRAAGAWLATPCSCGQHTPTAQNRATAPGTQDASAHLRPGDRPATPVLA